MSCPVLPILLKYFPELTTEAKQIGDNPECSRDILKNHGFWEDEWDDLWQKSQRRNNDPVWVETADKKKVEEYQRRLVKLVTEKIRHLTSLA